MFHVFAFPGLCMKGGLRRRHLSREAVKCMRRASAYAPQPRAKSTEVSFRGSPIFQMSRPRRSSHFRYLTLSLPRMGTSRSFGVWSVRPRRPSGSARARARAGRSLLQSFCSSVAGPSPLTRRGVAFSRLLRLLLQIEMNGRARAAAVGSAEGRRGEGEERT